MQATKQPVAEFNVVLVLTQAEAEVLLALLARVNIGEPVSDQLCARLESLDLEPSERLEVSGGLVATYIKEG